MRAKDGTLNRSRAHAAAAAILERYADLRSWERVAHELGFNRGFVYAVANGKRRPSARLLVALGLKYRSLSRRTAGGPIPLLAEKIKNRRPLTALTYPGTPPAVPPPPPAQARPADIAIEL
jgi:hypothetical protein